MSKKAFLIFSIVISFLASCKKDDSTSDPLPEEQDQITINSQWQYTVSIDGTVFIAVEGQQNYIGSYSSGGVVVAPPDTSSLTYTSILTNDSLLTNDLYVSKGILNITTGQIPDSLLFAQFFATGNYNYSASDGIIIDWYDAAGEQWSTKFSPATQSGSAFLIKDVQFDYVNGYLNIKINATFNCKLYNSSGQFKTLSSGHYVGSFLAF